MKIGIVDLVASAQRVGSRPEVRVQLAVGPLIRHNLDVSPDQARAIAAQLLAAATEAEGKGG